MNIEPCPFCGSEVITDTFERISCPNCCYRGGVLLDSNEQHNRISRIVRAAEAWVREEKIPGNLSKIQEAEDALRNAVEGGRADGATS